jgi:hypothetical protein
MSGFWDVFKKTAYFRFSWFIQDKMIESVGEIQKMSEQSSLEKNKGKIIDAVYDNEFSKHRNER